MQSRGGDSTEGKRESGVTKEEATHGVAPTPGNAGKVAPFKIATNIAPVAPHKRVGTRHFAHLHVFLSPRYPPPVLQPRHYFRTPFTDGEPPMEWDRNVTGDKYIYLHQAGSGLPHKLTTDNRL